MAEWLALDDDELIVDNFAGGGGASTGIGKGLGRSLDIAINHDPEAIAMHKANHPETEHYCESVWRVDPVKACRGRRVGLAWFSPDCKHFSKAKGGKPVNKQIRGLAWVAIRWAKRVEPRVIILENVEEFVTWGPIGEDGKPCPRRRGMTFKRWKTTLENLGYVVEHRELRACDYGAPTIRKRLFVIARRDGLPIVWPKPTHEDPKKSHQKLKPWRTAAECIDWSLPCPSIFERKRPLAENTMRRIAAGVKRYVIESPTPFIVNLTHQGGDRVEGLDEPLKTVTGANRGEKAFITPYLARLGQTGGNGKYANDCLDPLTTITSKAEHILLMPTLVQTGYGERPGQAPRAPGLHKPLGTVVASGQKHALVSVFLAKHYTGVVGSKLGDPISTVTAVDHHSLVTAHIQRDFSRSVGHPIDIPLGTVTAGGGGKGGIVTSHLVKLHGTCKDGQPVDAPMATIRAQGTHIGEVRTFLLKYFGTDQDPRLDEPLHTVTTKDRFGLVTVLGDEYVIVDIGMRMLSPRELYRAQGFEDDYQIEFDYKGKPLTKTAQVRMCGNSVAPPIAAAVARAQFQAQKEALCSA